MTEWQSVAVVVVAILIAIFTHRLWLPSLLSTLRSYHIAAVWADKKYSLTVAQAENVIDQQQSALLDSQWGVVSRLTSIPGVRKVELAPKIVAGQLTGELVFRVTVAKKRPLHELPSNQLIPTQIGNVPTDVVEAR
jgi:hypothetical protein